MSKFMIFMSFAVLVVAVATIAPKAVYAYRGDPNVKGPNYSEERHIAMEKAFETKDYNAWKELMGGKGRVSQVINEQNFARFAEAHELAENGDLEGARKIREELGLGLKNGSGFGMKQGRGGYGCVNR